MKRYLIAGCAALALIGIYAAARATELSPLLSTMNADNVTLYPGLLTYPADPFHPMGVIYTIPASVATGTGTGAQTLGTYSLPANSLDAVGRKLRITASFTTAANTNTKTCTLNFGAGPETISTGAMATSGETAVLSMVATKTAASVQTVWSTGQINTTLIKPVVTVAAAEVDTGALSITAICTDGTNSTGDATLADLFVEYMN